MDTIISGGLTVMTLKMWRVLLLLPICLAASCGNPAAPEVQKLQGEWTAVSIEENGSTLSPEQVRKRNMKLRFDGYSVTMVWEFSNQGTFTVDPTAQPKTIDFTIQGRGSRQMQMLGIYDWNGDNLKICFLRPPDVRPGEFRIIPPNEGIIAVFQRSKS